MEATARGWPPKRTYVGRNTTIPKQDKDTETTRHHAGLNLCANSVSSETDEWPSPIRATATSQDTNEVDASSPDSPTQNHDAEDTPASSASEADTSKKRDREVGSSPEKESPLHTQHTDDPTTGVRNNRRKHYLPPQVRRHARPQKQRLCTSSADTPPLKPVKAQTSIANSDTQTQ
jgi:hypothetical protein